MPLTRLASRAAKFRKIRRIYERKIQEVENVSLAMGASCVGGVDVGNNKNS